jgi:hypothetical protein
MTRSFNLLCLSFGCVLSVTLFSQNVNPFTGSLDYGLPLMSVPSDKGNAIPINLIYGGNGINVEQPATEVGLGWSLSAGGSIVRSVSGLPDDISAMMFDMNSKKYPVQTGCLLGPTSADILTSRRNLDSVNFYFPAYDSYNVSGPGIGGSMTPLILNYVGFKRDTYGGFNYDTDAEYSKAWTTPQFMFNGDFADTLVSRHYPDPVYTGTPFKLPIDAISGACYNDASSYYGKKNTGTGLNCAENYDPTTNRLGTSNYVEYTMGSEGIQSFTITNSAGFVYNYTLPVYLNYSVNYSYPLNNDYSIPTYTNSFTPAVKTYTDNAQYFVEHSYPSSGGSYVVESKSTVRYAKEWKLTSVTGPDYVDVNANNVPDAGDQGYWVLFDYKIWSGNFTSRYPAYGFNYFSGTDSKTSDLPLSDASKRSGKLATATLINEELYYLNTIQTSTHKAIFIRDIRQDEIASDTAYGGLQNYVKIDQTDPVKSWHGNMFDEGGTSGGYTQGLINYTKTVYLGKVSKVKLNVRELSLNYGGAFVYDKLHIYAGPNTSSPEISFTVGSTNYTSPFTNIASTPGLNTEFELSNYTATSITFMLEKIQSTPPGYTAGTGFNVEWHAVDGSKTPQLYVKRVLLYNSYTTLPSISQLADSTSLFDFSATTNLSAPLYNETWYRANQSQLDLNSLKGSHLYYDYSLAKKYHRNINCSDYYLNNILSSPANVLSGLLTNTPVAGGTGKLTLNKVRSTEYQGYQLFPTDQFDYMAATSSENPDYNPMKVDTWGFHKSDATSLSYYGYVSNTSKDYTDAWLLKKITSPYGGTTELEYEPNSYTKVSDGKGSYRKACRLFPIESISTVLTDPLTLNMEEGLGFSADLSEMYNVSYSAGYIWGEVFIPTYSSGASADLVNYFGEMKILISAPPYPLPIMPAIIEKKSEHDTYGLLYTSCSNLSTGFLSSSSNAIASAGEYTGGGWVKFSFPDNTIVYGGGNRVKKITSRNGTDAYSTLYEYENGVALNEADRFAYPVYRYSKHANCAVPGKLEAFGSDNYDMRASIGYKTVRVKNLGQINASKGWTEMTFTTNGMLDEDALVTGLGNVDNYVTAISDTTMFTSSMALPFYSTTCTRIDTGFVLEYTDKFSPFWGLLKEQKQYDVNSNMLSRTVNEYEATQQGAIVENFVFRLMKHPPPPAPGMGSPAPCNNFSGSTALYQTCVKRHYPAVLKKSTSYGMGSRSISETLLRDEITGEATMERISGDNRSSVLSVKKPAFRISTYAAMGPKSVNAAWSNVLGADAFHYASVDTTLSVTAGQPGVNFASASASVYTTSVLMRTYNPLTNVYSTASVTRNWYNSKSYDWAGIQGSLDSYGLYKTSELAAYPFNFATPSSSSNKWRLSGETTLMDEKGHILETRNFNNKFSAIKLDFNNKYLVAQAQNCNYASFTYSGFEYANGLGSTDGEINMPLAHCYVSTAVTAHTGNMVALVNAGGMGPNYAVSYDGTGSNGEDLGLMLNRIYRASVWVHTSSASGANLVMNLDGSIGGSPVNQSVSMNITDAKAVTIGSWKLLYVDLKVPSNYTSTGGTTNKLTVYLEVQGSGTAYFDDLQFHPVESVTSGKVYDIDTGRVLAEISQEGYAVKYVYDAAGNVIDTYKEIPGSGFKIIKHKSYNYARGTN